MRDRLKSHFSINTHLSLMSNKALELLLSKAKLSAGWGQNGIVEIEGRRVFVKIIPVTDLEVSNAYSTKNLYRIPTWYNYGVGSAGFGAFRELAAHVKTTNWVRSGQFAAFPLLHHHRIITSDKRNKSIPELDEYVAYWNGSKSVERYMLDRSASKQHLLLFLECLTPLSDWVAKNPSKIAAMLPKALKSIDFLYNNGLIHFDAHIDNWLTDGRNLYLSDFGLVLDREFELTESEKKSFEKHRFYDYTQVVETFGRTLLDTHFSIHPRQGEVVDKEIEQWADAEIPRVNLLLHTALALHKANRITLPASLIEFIHRYQTIMIEKNCFLYDIYRGRKTTEKYPAQRLEKLLRQVGIVD